MPIRSEERTRYPANWSSEIVPAVRARSGNRCEECEAPNRTFVVREVVFGAIAANSWVAAPSMKAGRMLLSWWRGAVLATIGKIPDLHGPVEIVLTTAHDPDPSPENCDLANLRHLCQLCHNRLDAQERADNRKQRERAERIARHEGKLFQTVGGGHGEESQSG